MNEQRAAVVILEIGAEGGSITVSSRTSEIGHVEYSVRLRDQSLTFLQGDEDGGEIRRDVAWTDSWDEAMAALGRWPWPMLVPIRAHPDYAERVMAAVEAYRGQDGRPARERGSRLCRESVN